MKSLCLLMCIALANCFYIDDAELSKDKIVEGNHVKIEQVPYQANLVQASIGMNFCGAAIIHESWVLTAAHCVHGKTGLYVRSGSDSRIKYAAKHLIEKIIEHPKYNNKNNDQDIALIKLRDPIKFNAKQKAIPLATSSDIPKVGDKMLISGFGMIEDDGEVSPFLKAATVPVVDYKTCKKVYAFDPITDNMFCAGDGDADSCNGDSGGPGVINGKLYGIISNGMICASPSYPGVYTPVHKYYDWILQNTEGAFKNSS